MLRRIGELPARLVVGGLVVAGGLALWQLGIEFERAWLRSYEGPLMGETIADQHDGAPHGVHSAQPRPQTGEQRRRTVRQQRRAVPRSAVGGAA